MPRLRTLKPGYFTNEDLVALPPLVRLLFAGLWCWADRQGRLEDRPGKLKLEILPADEIDVDDALDQLAARGFVARYEVAGKRYLQVLNFGKHQTPHVKEAASTLPAPDEHQENTVLAPPVFGEWVVGSGNLEPETGGEAAADAAPPEPEPTSLAIPKTPKLPPELVELRAAFEARSLRAPPLQAGAEFQAAKRLLKRAREPDELAACWQDVRSGDWGDDWDQRNLSFVMLERNDRFGNWQAWKGGEVGTPKRGNGIALGRLTEDQKRQRGIIHG